MRLTRLELMGPLAPYGEGFCDELQRLGYTASPIKKHLYLLAHLSRWLDDQGLDVQAVATPAVGPFFEARRRRGTANLRTTKSLAPLVAYLTRVEALEPVPSATPKDETERLLEKFRTYLRSERGLVEGTARFYVHIARLFVAEHRRGAVVTLDELSAHNITAFTTQVCVGRGLSSCRQAVSALRSFLRYLRLVGMTPVALEGAVLSVAGWDPSLPRAISTEDVAAIVGSCDRSKSIGRRDYAILLLLARLGLRGGEIVAMRLEDLHWRAGELTVRGKGRRSDRLPLPADVGEAVAAYLRRDRPVSDSRHVFLRAVAPFRGFAGHRCPARGAGPSLRPGGARLRCPTPAPSQRSHGDAAGGSDPAGDRPRAPALQLPHHQPLREGRP